MRWKETKDVTLMDPIWKGRDQFPEPRHISDVSETLFYRRMLRRLDISTYAFGITAFELLDSQSLTPRYGRGGSYDNPTRHMT